MRRIKTDIEGLQLQLHGVNLVVIRHDVEMRLDVYPLATTHDKCSDL